MPDAASGWSARRPIRAGARTNALYVAPIPLLFTGWGGGPAGLALDLAAFFVLMAAAHSTREGIRAEMAYEARAVARRPALPRKLLGAVLTGAGLALAGLPAIGGAIALAGLGVALHVGAFGIDPLRNKRPDGAEAWQSDRAAEAIDAAEAHLAAMRDHIARTGDRPLTTRVEAFADTARGLFRTVERDPRDLPQARAWLGVYLLGARDAAAKYADLAANRAGPAARAEFVALLDDLEQGFARRTEAMLLDDRSDLDVEIEVLRDRLRRDDLAPAARDEV